MRLALPIALAMCLLASLLPAQSPTPNPTPDPETRRSERRSRAEQDAGNPATDEELRRAERRKDRERSKKSEATKTPAGQAKPEDAGKSVRGGQAKAAKKAPEKGGEARGATSVEFKISANPYSNVLFLESISAAPTMNIRAEQGSEFATRTVFSNGRRSVFDTIEVSLKYDPSTLTPLGIDDQALQPYMLEPAIAQIDRKKGIIAYRVELTDPVNFERFTMFKIAWKAVRPAELTHIAFLNTVDFPTRILSGTRNILKTVGEDGEVELSDNAGLLNADVTITPTGGDETAFQGFGPSDNPSALGLAIQIGTGSAEGNVSLKLRPRQNAAVVGDDLLVDIVFENPRSLEVDLFKLKIRFDPEVLEVVDYDDDNWITRGINIYDGAYHDDLPFDFHLKNSASNPTGTILYEMGFRSQVSVPAQGTLATIRFRAKKPSAATEVSFDFDEDATKHLTSVSFLGFNLIGTPGARKPFLSNAVVRIN